MNLKDYLQTQLDNCEHLLDLAEMKSQNQDTLDLIVRVSEEFQSIEVSLNQPQHQNLLAEFKVWFGKFFPEPEVILHWSALELFEAGYQIADWRKKLDL